MNNQHSPFLALVAVVVLHLGCSVAATSAPQPTAAPTPDIPLTVEAVVNLRLSEISTVNLTPVPTSTVTPTPRPTPTLLRQATSTPRPTPTPTFPQVTAGVRNAIVQIETPVGTGSGTIINPEGDILTNYHVIKGYNNVNVRINDAVTVTGSVVGFDEFKDVAIVNTRFRPLTFVPLSSRRPEIGEEIITIGYPRVDLVGIQGGSTLTRGIVSAIRQIGGQTYIQTDAAINPGNSGGAAIDRDGNFIGIPTAKFIEADNIGLLVPGFDIFNLIRQLQGGYRFALPPPTPSPTATPRPTPTPSPQLHLTEGQRLFDLNLFNGAIIEFTRSIESREDDLAYIWRGISYFELAKYDLADNDFRLALARDPQNGNIHRWLGYTAFKKKLYITTISELTEIIYYSATPPTASDYEYRARAYLALEKYRSAIDDFSKAIDLEPTGYRYGYRGNAYYGLNPLSAQGKLDWDQACILDFRLC